MNQNDCLVSQSVKEVAHTLDVDIRHGLTREEVKRRQTQYGENKLNEGKKKSIIRLFLEQMNNPMIYILFAAIMITMSVAIYQTVKAGFDFFENWADVLIILAVIVLNAVIGVVQEKKAEASLESLKKLSSPLVSVLRDGKLSRVKASGLTLGDVVVFEEGEVIGADLRLIESVNLKINESSLTGESVAVEKNADLVFTDQVPLGDRLNMAYASTVVAYGRGRGVVVKIGMSTEIGKIADSITQEAPELTPLQKVLAKLSKFLGFLTIAIVLLVLIVNIIWICVDGSGSQIDVWINAVLNAIALAVAAIPEGLVAVVTIVLSLGVTRMVKAHTIVRKLPSVETLGSVNVICSDKTGTLTQNKMTVVEAYFNHKKYIREHFTHDLDFLAKGLALCSNATIAFGDPTEIALVEFAHTLKLEKDDLEKQNPRISELPFDSVRKMMSTQNGEYIFTKGAFDEIIKRSKSIVIDNKCIALTKKHVETLKKINQQYSTHGLRVLALAYTKKKKIDEHDLIFVGLVAMIDPPRPEVAGAVSKLKGAGIRTIMITGDHIDTAYAIAHKLGISDNPKACLTGLELDALSFNELKEKVKTVNVYGRVSPQNKVDIVKALKANQETVAMTGDGVNDAPSLKSADIGIAMGITGTDVAKDASDMILTDDNFASIEKAVEEGRGIFANIRKSVLFLLSSNIAEVFVMFIVVCLGLPAPLVAVHLLWINLVTDSTPAIALGVDPKDKNVMREKPRKQKENFLSNGRLESMLFYGAIITLGVLVAFLLPAWQAGAFTLNEIKALYTGDTLTIAQTMAFTTLAFAELFHMLGTSEPNRSFITVFKHKNKLMYLSFALGVSLQLLVVLTPGVNSVFKTVSFAPINWLYVSLLSLLPLIVHEVMVLVKYVLRLKRKKK